MHPGRLYQGNQRLELLWHENRSRQTIAATTLKPLSSNSGSRRFSFAGTVGSVWLTCFLVLEIGDRVSPGRCIHTWAALCLLWQWPISLVPSWCSSKWRLSSLLATSEPDKLNHHWLFSFGRTAVRIKCKILVRTKCQILDCKNEMSDAQLLWFPWPSLFGNPWQHWLFSFGKTAVRTKC